MAASTTALPPSTYLHGERQADVCGSCCFCCEAGHLLAICFEACAGRRVRRLCSPALFCRLCACRATFAMSCPLPSTFLPPVQVCFAPFCSFCLPPVHSMCARIIIASTTVCKLQDCPVGSCNTGLQWRPVRRFIFDFCSSSFSCRVHDPGPWVECKNIRLSCNVL